MNPMPVEPRGAVYGHLCEIRADAAFFAAVDTEYPLDCPDQIVRLPVCLGDSLSSDGAPIRRRRGVRLDRRYGVALRRGYGRGLIQEWLLEYQMEDVAKYDYQRHAGECRQKDGFHRAMRQHIDDIDQ